MSEKATFKEVDLTGAKIGGVLSMIGGTFKGTLTMNRTDSLRRAPRSRS